MPLSDVSVRIDIASPTSSIGFGTSLVLSEAEGGIEYKEYFGIEEVLEDFEENSEEHKAALRMFAQDPKPERVAIAGKDLLESYVDYLRTIINKGWFRLTSVTTDPEEIEEISDFINGDTGDGVQTKVYFARTDDENFVQVLKEKEHDNTLVFYHEDISNYPEAGLAAVGSTYSVGEITYKFKNISGIEPLEVSSGFLNELHTNGAITYVTKAGDNQTSEGIVVTGEYLDVIEGKHWVQVNIENRIQKLFNNSPKVPITNSGIASIEDEVITVLDQAFENGIIADDGDGNPLYSTDFPTREELSEEDRASRRLRRATFRFELAGAFHDAVIEGEILF
ncbi:DUF3383 family protein [Desertibacillus haloalkaliphilus]|uniref:DUF3383 family protein n=1 Tax=Desertibacillus haloalkaliphilus TaxID=1328930 RepID=UPI001C25BF03|nr:DUF3383 family protein [Desertibacillus haloalkaliphilus]MBU8908505.1 DUF3383 domain-containing protein [Desertibacillus haloalkaliphilus]